MPIRLSGMVSGMDTDTLVTALVSGYQTKKDNLVKAQTKLSWKQEKWKTMNTSIYGFYSGKLSAARFSNAYNLKKSTVSNSSVATVTASSSAVSGTQKLVVKQLATSGYLTGGKVENRSDTSAKITGSSKLSDITGMTSDQGSVSVSVDGKTTSIQLTDDLTVNQFVAKLKDAGVQASFDENNQRFFISSKTSGAAGDFSIVADNENGMKSLQNLGLYTKDDTSLAEYKKWSEYWSEYSNASDDDKSSTALGKIIESAYNSQKTNFNAVASEKLATYNKAVSIMTAFETKYKLTDNDTEAYPNITDPVDRAQAMLDDQEAALKTTFTENSNYFNDNGEFDVSKLGENEKKQYDELVAGIKTTKDDIANYNEAKTAKDENAKYVNVSDDGSTVTALKSTDTGEGVDSINSIVEERNNTIKDNLTKQYESKAQSMATMYANMINASKEDATDEDKLKDYAVSSEASRITGQDSIIELNNALFKSNTNNYSINGLTIQVTEVTGDDNPVTITTDTDVDAIYNSIKDMFTEYNKLIKSMDEAYNADSSKGYEPLTDDEKDAMSDTEVEKWETKIKDSLLRKDSTLSSIINTLKNDMASSFTINGKSYSLASFGIATLGYFSSGENEKGVYHIDGDKDDTSTSGNDDKLRAAIAGDPETVVSFFSQLYTKVYTDLGKKMAASSVSSIYTVYNDKQMNTQYSEYNTKISAAADKVTTWEDYYYSKFSAMESALAKLNSQSSSLSGLFGS